MRDLILDFKRGGASVPEVVHGIVRIWGTEVRPNGPSVVVTTETTLKLSDGKATLANAQTSGTGPLYEWAYIIQVEPFCGRNYRFYVAIPDGTGPVNLVDLPKLNPYTGEGFYVDIEEWEALYGDLPDRVDAVEAKNTSQDGRLTAIEARPGGWSLPADYEGNLNALITSGLYRNSSSAFVTLANNYPKAGSVGVIEVIERNSTSVLQRFTPTTGATGAATFYERYSSGAAGAAWLPWRAYNSTRTDNTAGRAIYQWDDTANREQLIYGDTGWRDIRDLITADWIVDPILGANSKIMISREGNTVHLQGWLKRATFGASRATYSRLLIPPTGFRPDGFNVRGAVTISTAITGLLVTATTQYAIETTIPLGGNWADGERITFSATWRTLDAWPTTLPGTAFGTIPNL